jgi:hypothetical protein
MRNSLLLICLLFFSIEGFSQTKFHPKGVVLYPFEKVVDASLKDSIGLYRSSSEITEEMKKQFIPANLPPNWKMVRENELKVMHHPDYFSLLSMQVEREINYKLIENYSHALILVVKDSSKTDLVPYKALITHHKVDWIINPSSIRISKEGNKNKMDVKFQAYYHPLGYTILNTSFTVAETDAVDCTEAPLTCLMDAAAKKMAALTVDKIERVR